MLCDAKIAAEKRLRGSGAETDDDVGTNGRNFRVEPWTTGGDFGGVRFLVDAAFSARFPFEMLHGIRDVHFLAIDAGILEGFVEKLSSGADEWFAFEIFLTAGLLADENYFRLRTAAFAENRLSGVLPEITRFAIGSLFL